MNERRELLMALANRALQLGEVLLSSGKKSNYYIDCRRVTLDPYYGRLAGRLLLQAYRAASSEPVQGIGGPSVGADPLVMSMIFAALDEGQRLYGLFVRKRPKNHGTGAIVEGAANMSPGSRVLLVEDVVTTGGSLLQAVLALRQAGFVVEHAVALVDRGEGGAEALKELGVQLIPLFSASEVLRAARGNRG